MSDLRVTTHWDGKSAMPHALAQEPTVIMVFPRKVVLQLDEGHGFVEFEAGVNEVPKSLAGHWYLGACGVKSHAKPAEKEAAAGEQAATTEEPATPKKKRG